jgi:parvulin-like peptidyl-prolyl isomerase
MTWACVLCSLSAVGQQVAAPPDLKPAGPKAAVVVDGETIHDQEVDRELKIAARGRPIEPLALDALRARTLEQLISRRLVQRWLNENGHGATEADIDSRLEQLRAGLNRRGQKLDDFLDQQELDESGLRRSLAWQIAWGRFLDRQRTDANLEKYFQKHRRDFDGTTMRVAHILWQVSPDDPQSLAAARTEAREILARIRAGSTSFADAARTHSDAPTAAEGGDIGWIGRKEPMPESFTRSAFALETGQVSEPTTTALGVHLIQCLEIRPGQKRWQDVRGELEDAVTRYLFEWTANQVRPRASIDYAPDFPHFQPGTETLQKK